MLTIKLTYSDDEAYVRVSIIHSDEVNYVCIVVGWIYFAAWSVSFYPQCYENIKRKRQVIIKTFFRHLNSNVIFQQCDRPQPRLRRSECSWARRIRLVQSWIVLDPKRSGNYSFLA